MGATEHRVQRVVSFISYAQNYEDVILLRALRNVENGFYIDVGAQHPRNDSVTKAFYDRGWHGINIEPVAGWHRLLVEHRPRDINLCLAAGAAEGTVELFEVEGSGLSTTSAAYARRHGELGFHVHAPRQVPLRRLDAICAEHRVAQVHFLKVDAEGAEAEVLRGIDLQAVRPWVVLVEAREPNSQVSNYGDWEPLLTGNGYRFVYDDGLNRFYLADEHAGLAPALALPPNILDGFVRREQVDEAERLLGLLRDSDSLSKDRAEHIGELASRIGARDIEISRLLAAHHRDVGQLQAQAGQIEALAAGIDARAAEIEARRIEGARLAEHHRQTELAMQDQAALREQRINALEAEGATLRNKLLEIGRKLEHREQSSVRVSRELMAAQAAQLAAETARQATHGVRLAAEAETVQVRIALDAERQEYARVMASRSWRVTAPLRATSTWAREALIRVESAARGLARLRPARALAAALLLPFPGLARSVKRRLYGEPVALPELAEIAETAPLPLTADAEAILARAPVPTGGNGKH